VTKIAPNKYKIAVLILSILLAVESTALIFLLTRHRAVKKMPKVALPLKGKIAIVIDDWGYHLDNLRIARQIKYPFTASVLPRVGYSRVAAEELHGLGFEVILHLPMEPHEKYSLEKDTILVSSSEQDIINTIAQDLADLRYAVGVSNHMGSSVTEDPRVMSIVLRELKRRNLFFLDSLVSSHSICSDLAPGIKVKFIKRDIFLDNKEDADYIKVQMYKLKRKAQAYGYAVGIGHDRKVTLEVLREIMPEFEKEGYKFVFVSELVK
jgi:uncharacterized protein